MSASPATDAPQEGCVDNASLSIIMAKEEIPADNSEAAAIRLATLMLCDAAEAVLQQEWLPRRAIVSIAIGVTCIADIIGEYATFSPCEHQVRALFSDHQRTKYGNRIRHEEGLLIRISATVDSSISNEAKAIIEWTISNIISPCDRCYLVMAGSRNARMFWNWLHNDFDTMSPMFGGIRANYREIYNDTAPQVESLCRIIHGRFREALFGV